MHNTLKSNNEFKGKMMKSFSHELKTPLNGASSPLENCLLDPETPQNIKEKYLIYTKTSLIILECVLNDIIDFGSILSNQFNLYTKNINIIDLINEIKEIIMPMIVSKKIELIIDYGNNEFINIKNDWARVKQVLLSIVRNAIKFTNQGFVKIRVFITNEYIFENNITKKLEEVCFEIIDNGIGMNSKQNFELKKILDHSDLNNLSEYCIGGGLGLIIANNIVKILSEKNEGICFISEENKGSTFWFKINSKDNNSIINSELSSIIPTSACKEKNCENINNSLIKCEKNNIEESHINPKSPYKEEMWEKIAGKDEKSENINNSLIKCEKNNIEESHINPRSHKKEMREKIAGKDEKSENNSLISKCNNIVKTDKTFVENKNCLCYSILIVDDDSFNVIALEMLLNRFGLFRIEKVFNGKEACEIIENYYQENNCEFCNGFKLIFMDYQMPVLDGVEATKYLKKLEEKKIIPKISIVACTAFNSKKEADDCKKAGMIDIIIKPVTFEKLRDVLKEYYI